MKPIGSALWPALLTGLLTTALPTIAGDTPFEFPRNNMAPPGPDSKDATVEMLGAKEVALRQRAARIGPANVANPSAAATRATIGDELTITIFDFGLKVEYDETFTVVMDGANGIILVEKDAYDDYDSTTDEYVFANPNGCWRPEDRISTAQLSYMLSEFDNTIHPTNTAVFGEPLPRGVEGSKTWILIHNIRDESYYDCSATSYEAGYFSASEDAVNNKNMMHIDTYDWANRTGPDADRPYLYESVFAREFEHLIHFDVDPNEATWVDKGLAELAGFLCGYGHPSGPVAYYMVYHPMVSLTFWGGGLEDYGASYLFALYLYEQFGGASFIAAWVQDQADGIEGVENTLSAFGYGMSFAEVFDNWTIANYVDDTRKAKGKYGYENLEIGMIDSWGYSIEYVLSNSWWGPPDAAPFSVSSLWFFGDEPQPYTAHYFRFRNDDPADVSIDGDDFSGTTAYSGVYEWYSDAEAWAWRSFLQTFSIPAGGATLSFNTHYDIEEDWDYGYVEVYDQDTDEWYTLNATGTVDYVAHPQDNLNTPDGRAPRDYEAAGRWHAFTGSSGGWIPVSMDLSPFAGHTIDLYFTTWQDSAFTWEMMYIDDISIAEIGFFDDVESGEDGWISTGWYVTDGIRDNDLGAIVMDTKGIPAARYPEPAGNNAMTLRKMWKMAVDSSTQSGAVTVTETPEPSGRVKVVVVANHADHILRAHYELTVE